MTAEEGYGLNGVAIVNIYDQLDRLLNHLEDKPPGFTIPLKGYINKVNNNSNNNNNNNVNKVSRRDKTVRSRWLHSLDLGL